MIRIRTSDRGSFRRCRRRWGWSSHLRHNLESNTTAEPLWTGTGIHFALEDFHGWNKFGHPVKAFRAFVEAWKRSPLELPGAWKEEVILAEGMMNHYHDHWLPTRDPLQTYWLNDEPQVEVQFEILLPCQTIDGEEIVYSGTIDRMIIDQYNRLWVLDYKTAKNIVTTHLEIDQQMTSYSWAADSIYELPLAGGIYQQHKKAIPEEPRWLGSGHYSTAKDQKTTHHHYREALLKLYNTLESAPPDNIRFLNVLAEREQPESDGFIQRNLLSRNEHQISAEGEKILLEVPEMVNSNTPLYPNPTRDCSWDCNFFQACISMDDGSDWEFEIENTTKKRPSQEESWRNHLQWPETVDLSQVQ